MNHADDNTLRHRDPKLAISSQQTIDFLRQARGDIPNLVGQERRRWLRRIESVKYALWIWMRAMRRHRAPRKRMTAVWIASGAFRRDPRVSSRSQAHRQNQRWEEWLALSRAEHERRGYRPTDEDVWTRYEARHGPCDRRLETGVYLPRDMKESVRDATDEAVKISDDLLMRAILLFSRPQTEENLLFWHHCALENVERLRVLGRSGEYRGSGFIKMEAASYQVLLDATLYVAATDRGRVPRMWFCYGCDEWHSHKEGAPPTHHWALLEMGLEAISICGVAHGDARRIWQERRAKSDEAMPTYRRWCQYIRKHYLRRETDRRCLVFGDRKRRPVFVTVDFGRSEDREHLARLSRGRHTQK